MIKQSIKHKDSIMQVWRCCYVCKNTIGLHKHHIFEGRNRNNSEEDGLWLYLCAKHHNMSDEGIHFNKELDLKVKKEAEKRWLEYYNKTIDDFIKRYGKNYIE